MITEQKHIAEADDGYFGTSCSDTMRRCEYLVKKHGPRLMKEGNYVKDTMHIPRKNEITPERKKKIMSLDRKRIGHAAIAKAVGVSTSTVARVIKESGRRKRKPKRKVPLEKRELIIEMRKGGATYKAIVEASGISETAILTLLKKSGLVKPRTPKP
jgi:DNA invertase Pin-like site-specific DNA recombinase